MIILNDLQVMIEVIFERFDVRHAVLLSAFSFKYKN